MTEITTAADTVHWLAIEQGIDFEPRLKLVCTAAPGAKCRLRPPDDREEWHLDDPDLVDSGTCWAVQWAEDGGWETIQCEDTEVEQFGRIPVTVSNDDGPVLHPVEAHPILPQRTEAQVKAEALREVAETAEDALSESEHQQWDYDWIAYLRGVADRIEREARP